MTVFYVYPFCPQAALWQRCKPLCDACKVFGSGGSSSNNVSRSSSSQVAAVKKEQEKQQAPPVEAQDGAQHINNINSPEAVAEQPSKRTKSGAKTK